LLETVELTVTARTKRRRRVGLEDGIDGARVLGTAVVDSGFDSVITARWQIEESEQRSDRREPKTESYLLHCLDWDIARV
jgi:hypothetical protein